ncbi:MAG: alpha/beta hydrolase fold domain-containing protein [Pyrinomonadaceae bacterium]
MIKVFAACLSLMVFLIVIWIIIPAPSSFIWLLAVGASEWSLWFAIISILIFILAISFLIMGSGGKLWFVSLIFSLAALIISIYPWVSILKTAKDENVNLSMGEYFSSLKFQNSLEPFTTHTFSNVDNKDLQLDYFAPQTMNENVGAAIIVIHGGGWNARNRNDFPQWNGWLAANGYTVFDIDYRLAPQPNYLTATGDVKCAVLWIKQHAAEFNISPDRIALFGRSAGAHLALLAAYSAGDPRLSPTCPANKESENVRAVVSFYAPIELNWAFDNPANQRVIDGPQTLSDFLGGNPHSSDEIRERFTLATPLAHISEKTPPTLFIHGGQDQLVREENMEFADEKLNVANIPHKTIFIPYAQHGFDYNFHGFGSQITKPAMLDFLRENTQPR